MLEILIYLSIAIILIALLVWMLKGPSAIDHDSALKLWQRLNAHFFSRFDQFIELTLSWRYLAYLERLFKILALDMVPGRFYGLKLLFFLGLVVLFSIFYINMAVLLMLVGAGFMLTFVLPVVFLRFYLARRKQGFLSSFSFFIDLLILCLSSGRSLNQSIKICAQYGLNSFLLENVQRLIEQVEAGLSQEQAWKNFAFYCQEQDVHTFVVTVLQAQRQGISLIEVLQLQSRRIKSVLYSTAEKKALALSTKLIFPIVVFIFPITFIILSFPLFHNLIADL